MTNDLLPDEIYVRRTTKKGLSAVRPESPLADRTVPNQASKLNRTKYIRGDLVSTPNKPADVDLDALKREVRGEKEKRYDMDYTYDLGWNAAIRAVQASGCLATGKGGDAPAVDAGELEAWVSELSDFLYRIAQWGNQDGLEAECLGQGLPAIRAHLESVRGDDDQ